MRMLIPLLSGLAVGIAGAPAQSPPPPVEPNELAAVRTAPNGLVTVAALDLPEPFLRHVLQWELRGAWRDANHRVQTPPTSTAIPSPASAPPTQGPAAAAASATPTILTQQSLGLDQVTLDTWLSIPFEVPELRGFRAPMGHMADDPWPFALLQRDKNDAQAQRYRKAAMFVAEHLAYDGLIRTVVRLMSEMEPPAPWTDSEGNLKMNRLRAVGVPVDLLAMFTIEGAPADQFLAKWAVSGSPRDIADSLATSARFNFEPTCAGFRVLAEDGSQPVGLLRMQLPTNRFREKLGDGSVLDVFRQLALSKPSMPMVVTIHADAVSDLVREMNSWNVPSPERIVIVSQPANVTQWAQDNAKAGTIQSPDGAIKPALLAPRYASRTELRTVCVPSDALATDVLGRSMMNVQASPLLFQGGNLMAIHDPRTGKNILLIGEAEVHRNRALGLSEQQVLDAFAIEFGVDHCVIIPAASFHIDLDMTIRRCGNEMVACVIDEVSAARLMLVDGVRALGRAGVLPAAQVEPIIKAIAEPGPNAGPALASVANAISKYRGNDGEYAAAFASAFVAPGAPGSPGSDPGADPGAPMLRADAARRFLLAMDLVMAHSVSDDQMASLGRTPIQRQYFESLRVQSATRDRLAAKLSQLGMRVHRIPGLSDYEVSINPVNGLHLGDRYLMPAFGGVFESVDRAAIEQFQRAFGPAVRIEPIRTAAVQSTDGGLHCMVGLHSN